MLNNVMVFAINGDEQIDISDILIELTFSAGLEKPQQEVTMELPYAVFSNSIPNYYIDVGTKIEIYDLKSTCVFRGTVNKSTISAKDQTLKIIAYDYILNLQKSKVVYKFENMSAFDCIKKIFDDLNIPYCDHNEVFEGILGGKDSEDGKIVINHLIKNKTAYDACMMIATECYQKYGNYYYMYMDVSGNVNLTPVDRYYSNSTIKVCSDKTNADGNLIDCTYTRDATDVVTRVKCYNSQGEEVSLEKNN